MKLRSWKQLNKHKIYKNIPVQYTVTAHVFEIIHNIVYFFCLLCVLFCCCNKHILYMIYVFCGYLLFLLMSAFVLRYFYLCETYEEEDE